MKRGIGSRAGKNPDANIKTTFGSSKRSGGGGKPRPKGSGGGIARKPSAKIRYKRG
jgi:hypothetical protein